MNLREAVVRMPDRLADEHDGETGGHRLALVVAAASSLSGLVLTGHLVRRVNLRLLEDGPPLGPTNDNSSSVTGTG